MAVTLLDRNVPAGDDFVNSVPVLTLPQEELKISCIHTDEWENTVDQYAYSFVLDLSTLLKADYSSWSDVTSPFFLSSHGFAYTVFGDFLLI